MNAEDELPQIGFSEAALRLQDYESETIRVEGRNEGSLVIDPEAKLDRFKDNYSLFGGGWVNEYRLQHKEYSGDWEIPLLEDEESISDDIGENRIFLDSITGKVKEYKIGERNQLGLLVEDYELE